jgi:hypothetical protein
LLPNKRRVLNEVCCSWFIENLWTMSGIAVGATSLIRITGLLLIMRIVSMEEGRVLNDRVS